MEDFDFRFYVIGLNVTRKGIKKPITCIKLERARYTWSSYYTR